MQTVDQRASTPGLRWRTNLLRFRDWLCDPAGGALVELALIVPLFTVLILGGSEFATLEFDSIEVSNAARAGVAYGSQSSVTAADTAGMRTAATNDAPDVAGIAASASEFWACSNALATHYTSSPTCTSGHVLNYVQVSTSATVSPLVRVPGLPTTYALAGLAIMRVQ
jgi:Flp pilus assembly protein TadG